MAQNVLSSRGATGNTIPAQGNGRRFVQRKRRLLMALEEVIERGVNTGKYVQGPYVAALEKLIAERWKVAAAVAVNSGSSALRLALEALQLEAGSEVLVCMGRWPTCSPCWTWQTRMASPLWRTRLRPMARPPPAPFPPLPVMVPSLQAVWEM